MTAPLTPEVLVPRLGEHLVQQGLISRETLQEALVFQLGKKEAGERILLGQALIELNYLTRQELDKAITQQILRLRNALEESNQSLERRVKERTSELNDAMLRLSELGQMKANFVANVSHELRSPLTHIKGYLELLANESLGRISEAQKSALQVTQKSAGKLENLIEDLILFSLASRGEMNLQMELVDLREVINEVIRHSTLLADDRKVTLHASIPANLPLVKADNGKITWAVIHLVDNAIKFTPPGGDVILSVNRESDSLLMVSVSDTGIGIPADQLAEVFEPFHQLDESSTRHFGGTGLGLALVQEIISAHGSIIEVDSKVGTGTRFHFPLLAVDTAQNPVDG